MIDSIYSNFSKKIFYYLMLSKIKYANNIKPFIRNSFKKSIKVDFFHKEFPKILILLTVRLCSK